MSGMILEFLGPWAWVAFGLLILAIEIAAPSTVLLWPGLAALIVGAVTLVLGTDNPIWPWQAQLLVFLVLSLLIAYFGRQFVKKRKLDESDLPQLNERGSEFVGKTVVLDQPIVNGTGRVKLGDTTWRVAGPDANAGDRVTIVSSKSGTLQVEIEETA